MNSGTRSARHQDLYNIVTLAVMCLVMSGATLLLRGVFTPTAHATALGLTNAQAIKAASVSEMSGMDMVSIAASADMASTDMSMDGMNMSESRATGAPAAGTVDVTIQGFAFNPPSLDIEAGTTVRWTNQDPVAHTVTSDASLFSSGNLTQGHTFQFTFDTPGTYAYHCSIHTGMQGTINVVAPSPTTTSQAADTSTSTPTGVAQASNTPQVTSTTLPSSTPVIGANVSIQNFAYSPITVTVQPGTTIRWTNLDNTAHTVTSNAGLFDSGVLASNQVWDHTFNTPGTFVYHCAIHGNSMTGYVVVLGPAVTATPTSPSVNTTTPTVQPTSISPYPDVPVDSPFYSYIVCLTNQKVISGYADGTFRPNAEVTRGQAAKIIANAAGYSETIPPAQQTFGDVAPSSPFWLFIERVALHGAISGYSCGAAGEPCPGTYYRPQNNMTRGQLAKIAANVAGYSEVIPTTTQTFADVPGSSPFWLFIERVALHGVISGYSCGAAGEPCPGTYFRSQNNVSRGQTSKIVANAFFPNCSTGGRP